MLKCKVCNDPFDSSVKLPFILRCGHTFCKLCMDKSFEIKRQFACLNCFFVSTDPDERMVNQIINDRSSYLDPQILNGKPQNAFFEPQIRHFDPYVLDRVEKSKSKGDMLIEQDSVRKANENPSDYFKFQVDKNDGRKCRMRMCNNQATVEDLCEKCLAGLQSVKKLKTTPLKGSFLASPMRLGGATPDRIVNSHNTAKGSNTNYMGSKSCRRIDTGLSTVKRVSSGVAFDEGGCKNPGCTKPINKADPNGSYCGYICRNMEEKS